MNVVGFGGGVRAYSYLYTLPTNSYGTGDGNGRIVASDQAVVGAGGRLTGNNYGFWRAFNADFNRIYYNPRVRYMPWSGVGTNNADFPNACPSRASLDPFQFPQVAAGCSGAATVGREVNLTGNIPAYTTGVPNFTTATGTTNVNVAARPWAHYYQVTAAGFVPGTRPAHNTEKVLVEIVPADNTYDGGPDRTDCVASGSAPNVCTYAEEIQNFANWFTYYRSREYSTKYALGRVVARSTGLRIGYGVINNVAADSLPIRAMNNNPALDNKRALLDQIYEVDSQNGTPLRSALDRAGRHYQCIAGDTFGSTGTSAPGAATCPVLAAPAGQCQQHFTLLFTDGAWNGDDGFATTNHDADGAVGSVDSAFDGGSFADTIGGTLADVAMNYYERDLHLTLANEVQTTARDVAGVPASSVATVFPSNVMHQHMKTYTIGFGLLGNLTSTQVANIQANPITPFAAWGNPIASNIAKVDDLFHAAHNARGAALSASDPTSLVNTISQAFEEFSQSVGAASAVSFDAARLNLGTTRFRGLFNIRDNSGELLAERLGEDDEYTVVWRA
jgi:type IV pilus assembly protein PilY1